MAPAQEMAYVSSRSHLGDELYCHPALEKYQFWRVNVGLHGGHRMMNMVKGILFFMVMLLRVERYDR